MKRPLFVIIGSVIVLVLIFVWVYILFFSEPKVGDESFADLGFGDTTDTSYDPTIGTGTEETEPIVDVSGPERLRQLTTRPVVGYQDVQKAPSSTPAVYYVESGTGHIFSIDLVSGEERRISGTTIPASREAVITPDGQFLMARSGSGNGAKIIVGEIDPMQESVSIGTIDERIVSFTATTDNTFLYAVQTGDSVIAKEYDPTTASAKNLFTTPFREAVIAWGKSAADTHHFYPKAAAQLEGYGYQVTKGKIDRLPADGYGFSLRGSSAGVLYSEQVNYDYRSFIYNTSLDTTFPAPLLLIPEKCAALTLTPANLVCGGQFGMNGESLPDNWYQGIISFADGLWLIDVENGLVEELVNITSESGRQLDVTGVLVSSDDQRLYFTNSHDNYLWTLDRSLAQ